MAEPKNRSRRNLKPAWGSITKKRKVKAVYGEWF